MINLNFKNWFLDEVTFRGGKFAGQNHMQVGTWYLIYLAERIKSGEQRKFYSDQDIKEIEDELIDRRSKGTMGTLTFDQRKFMNSLNVGDLTGISSPVRVIVPSSVPSVDNKWISATVTNDFAGMVKGSKVAMRKSVSGANAYEIKSVDDPSKTGMIDISKVAAHFRSDRDSSGEPIMIDEPIVSVITSTPKIEEPAVIKKSPKKAVKKSAGKNILDNLDDPENIEQKEIDNRFERIIKSGKKSHLVISALAGSGKTTMLKHLAWKYGEPDQNWLYLVFNSRNRAEATEKFPQPPVEVHTSNSFMGSILRDPVNQATIGVTTNIAHVVGENEQHLQKIKLLSDLQEFRNYARVLGVPIPEDYRGNIKYINQIKFYYGTIQNDAVKAAEYAKKYAINPHDIDAQQKIMDLMRKSFVPCEKSGNYISNLEAEIDKGNKWSEATLEAIDSCRDSSVRRTNDCESVFKLALYLLKNSLPKAIKSKQRIGGREVSLGELRDFTDDLWFGVIYADRLQWPKYDVVMVDEVQDFNEAQKVIVRKLAEQGAIIVAVGDKNQCHPKGTMISMTGGKDKPIEEIRVGDLVVSYNNGKSYFPGTKTQGRKVEEIACRPYVGEMITIYAGEEFQKCTPNHKCLVRFNVKNKYCLYVMIKGNNSRIGICRTNHTGTLGLTTRSVQKNADKTYLLNIFETERDARIAEQVASAKFGLPQLIFTNAMRKSPPQHFINEVYDRIGDNLKNAKECVEYYGRNWDHPLWTREEHVKFGKENNIRKSFITQACNLIDNFMQIRTFDGTNRGGKWETVKTERQKVNCDVYSLKVQPAEDGRRLYIADNIVTHNSIYKFNGADSGAFDKIHNMLSSISHDKNVLKTLTRNFRSRKNIIDFINQNTIVKNLVQGKKFTDGGEGTVTNQEVEYENVFNNIKEQLAKEKKDTSYKMPQTAFIARDNESLLAAAIECLKKAIPFLILGKNIAGDVIKTIPSLTKIQTKTFSTVNIKTMLDKFDIEYEREKERNQYKASESDKLDKLKEITEIMHVCVGQFSDNKVEEEINRLNQSGKGQGIDIDLLKDQLIEHNTIKDLVDWMKETFAGVDVDNMNKGQREELERKMKERNVTTLTSAHRSKGFEFKRVFILRDDKLGSGSSEEENEEIVKRKTKKSDMRSQEALEEDAVQEENIKYVAYSRAEDELHIIKIKGQPGVKDEF